MILLLISLSILSFTAAVESDASLDQVGLVRRWGYPVEKYEVTTDDGYILDLIRIPRGRNDNRNISRPAVLLVHGLLLSGSMWIMNLPEQSAGFLYADGGLDVFIANFRGTTYGRRHRKLNPDRDADFWKYSFDEMGRTDLPAIINKALAVSGQEKLYYVGESQGTLAALLLLSDRPRYNEKIKSLFLLSPIGTGHYMRGFVRVATAIYPIFWPLTDTYRLTFGSHEFLGRNQLIISVLTFFCSFLPAQEVCHDFMFMLAGPPDIKHFNASRAGVYVNNFPAGTSTRNLLHWAQIVSRQSVARFDYNNPLENTLHYGQSHPPVYNYTEIEVPIYLYWSRNDWLTTQTDIHNDLLPKLRKGIVQGAFEIPEFNHIDFVVSTDAAAKCYNPILNLIREDIGKEHSGRPYRTARPSVLY